jgi:UDP-glucose 4-epimerase
MFKTVIVTGARGFMGRHASRILAQRGYLVVGIGHGPWDAEQWKPWGLSAWHETEITAKTLAACDRAPHAILHFAGGSSVPSSLSDPLGDFHRTVVTTANILEFVRSQSPETKLVYPSSASVYGIVEKWPISEDVRPAPISPYGVHKWLSEEMLISYARQYRISAAVVRFFSVYGCGLRKQLLWDACRKISEGDLNFAGTGDELRDWIHIHDAVELMTLAMKNASPHCPIVNGGTGEGVCVRDIVNTLSGRLRNFGRSPQFSGTHRPGDPNCFVAEIDRAKGWGWMPTQSWRDCVPDYAVWWQKETTVLRAESETESARAADVR